MSSSECERVFNSIKNLVMTKRNTLNTTHISSLMLINIVGSPVKLFKPESYVLSWLNRCKRSAEEKCCFKRKDIELKHTYQQLWNVI